MDDRSTSTGICYNVGRFLTRCASFEMTATLGGAGKRAGKTPRRFACSLPLFSTIQPVISSEARNLPLGTRSRRNEESHLYKMNIIIDVYKDYLKGRGALPQFHFFNLLNIPLVCNSFGFRSIHKVNEILIPVHYLSSHDLHA